MEHTRGHLPQSSLIHVKFIVFTVQNKTTKHSQFIMTASSVLRYCFIRPKMDKEQTQKAMRIPFMCCWCLELSCVIYCLTVQLLNRRQNLKEKQTWPLQTCKQRRARPGWGTVSLHWATEQHSWDRTTCLRSGSSPRWASLTFSLSEPRLCASREERAAPREHRWFNYRALDKHRGTFPPVGRRQVQCCRPAAATIHLRFVYFSGRYKMTSFPLSSHLVLRKLSPLWWII